MNGEHDVLVFPVLGPHIGDMLLGDSGVIQHSIKTLVRQITLGVSFLRDCGVVHGGQLVVPLGDQNTYGADTDLHAGNIALEIHGLDGELQKNVFMAMRSPDCVPTLPQDPHIQMDTLPKYRVTPENLSAFVKRDDIQIKIIDFGEGSSSCIQLLLRALSSCSVFCYRATSEPALPTNMSGTGRAI